jgi:hypothetical protein
MDNTTGNTGSTSGARDKVREKAAEVAGKAKEKLDSQYSARSQQAVSEVQNLASALRNAATNVGGDGSASISATILTRVADRLDSVGTSFNGRDLDGIVDDVERFARRSPAAFIGGAMLLGFAASRFLKSSGRHSGYDAGYDFDRGFTPTPGNQGGGL